MLEQISLKKSHVADRICLWYQLEIPEAKSYHRSWQATKWYDHGIPWGQSSKQVITAAVSSISDWPSGPHRHGTQAYWSPHFSEIYLFLILFSDTGMENMRMCSTRPGLSQYEQIRLDNIRQREEMFRTLDFNQVIGAGLDKLRSEKAPNSLFHPSCWLLKSVCGCPGLIM